MWEIDLIDLSMYSNINDSNKYILMVIDCFSKFLFAVPLKNKTPLSVVNAFKEIFKVRKPSKIRSDRGKEFDNRFFKVFCENNGINYFTTQNSITKCAIVERVNRTIKEKMFKVFTHFGTRRWIDFLPLIVNAYNNSKHSTTLIPPNEVTVENEDVVFRNVYKARNFKELFNHFNVPKFSIGDKVRVKYELKPMDKSYFPLWSEVVYTIKKVLRKYSIPQYVLELNGEELPRRFYPEELQKVTITENTLWRIERILGNRTKNGVREVRVKWFGYPSKFNSWIPEVQIQTL